MRKLVQLRQRVIARKSRRSKVEFEAQFMTNLEKLLLYCTISFGNRGG